MESKASENTEGGEDQMKPLHDLAAKWDANAARNQRNGQSLIDQGDEYGSEGLAIAEALGACVIDLRAALADYETDTDAQPAPDLAATEALRWFAVDGQWLTCTDDGRLDMRAELLAVRRAVRQAFDLAAVASPAAGTALLAELRDRVGVGEPVDRPGDQWAAPELAAMAETRNLRARLIALAASLDAEALATEPSKKSQIQADAARRIREALA